MAAFSHETDGGGTSGTGNRTLTVTSAVSGSLMVVGVFATVNNNTTPTMTDDHADGLGTYTLVAAQQCTLSASVATLSVFVRNSLLGSTDTSFIITAATGTNNAAVIGAIEVTGMTKVGAAAIRSKGGQTNGTASTAPAPALNQNALTGNMTMTFVGSATTSTPNASWTERTEASQATPTTDLEIGMTIPRW